MLGILWSVLNPLGMMLVMTVVFSHLFRAGIENFPVYLMCGQLVFNFYNEASNSAMNSIIWNGALIKKFIFPNTCYQCQVYVCTKSCEPLNIVYCVNYCYCDNKISGFMDIFTGNSSGYLHMDVCIWNGNDFLCVLVTAFRDVQHLYGVIIVAWMYLTPIFYPVSMLPEWVAKIVNLNPLTAYVEMIRDVILYCRFRL